MRTVKTTMLIVMSAGILYLLNASVSAIDTTTKPLSIKKECVVLLHGLARTDSSMKALSKKIEHAGFETVNQRYPSTTQEIQTLAKQSVSAAIERCSDGSTVNFVTHSMGGILVRQFFHDYPYRLGERMGRVVMLGPPNRGSEVVDNLKSLALFKKMNGPAGSQLGTDKNSVPNLLGSVNFDLGVIAGNRSMNMILSTMLPKQDDGKVSVESTKLEGMDDHLVLPVTHTFMMNNKIVIKQTIYFLQNGYFQRSQ